MRPVGVWLSVVGSVAVVAAVAVGCWMQPSIVAWLTNLGVLAILLVVTIGYDQPGRHLVRAPFGWVFPLLGLVGAASVVRLGGIGWPHVSSMAMGGIVVTLVVLIFVLVGLREPGRLEVAEPFTFPLGPGRWSVGAGGVTALNHHLIHPAQAAALDLIAIRADGARAAGVCPRDTSRYESFGREVLSPCPGVVVTAYDEEPDQPPYRNRAAPGAGNHVRIDNGSEIVLLTHLRRGSVRVAAGDTVAPGQPIGEIGNSGHSSEPHLHVHAERDGHAVRLRFTDVPARRLRPGVLLTVEGASRESSGAAGSDAGAETTSEAPDRPA